MVRQFMRWGLAIVCTVWIAEAWALDEGYVKFSGGITAPESYTTENMVLVDFGFASTFDPARLDRDLGLGFTGAAALGFRPMDRLRLEFEAGYSRSEADTTVFTREGDATPATRISETDLMLINGMANGWFDVARFDSVSLFFGAGVGISYVVMNSVPANPEPVLPEVFLPDESDDTIAFAWQAGGGLSVQVSESWALGAEYRYFDTVGAEFSGSDFTGRSHFGLVSVSYLFGRGAFDNPDGDYRRREPVNEAIYRR